MLLRNKERHHREMLLELDDVILDNGDREENESPYLVDYLYGISDIESIVNEYLFETGLNEEWVMFYRCLINEKILTLGNYDELREIGEKLFLMRNEKDFEKFTGDGVSKNLNKIKDSIEEILDELLNFVKNKNKISDLNRDNLFKSEDIKHDFIELIQNFVRSEKKDEEENEKIIYKLDKFLAKALKNEQIIFSKTDFFKEILKISKSKISSIQKKYEKEEK